MFNVTNSVYYNASAEEQPLNASVAVPKASPFDITFSDTVASSSILSHTVALFRVMPDGGNETPIDVKLTLIGDGTKVRISPLGELAAGGNYTLYIPTNNYGVRAHDGTILQNSYSCAFTVVDAVSDPETADEIVIEDIDAIPAELYFSSSLPSEGSIMEYGSGAVTISFDGRLPVGGFCTDPDLTTLTTCEAGGETWTRHVEVDVSVTHPLAIGTAWSSYWKDNIQDAFVLGKDIYLTSKILYASLSSEEQGNLAIIGTDPITEDSIVCINKVADVDGYIVLDFDVNRQFTFEIDISVNEHNPTLSFSSLLSPFYASLNEVKLDVGPFINQYDDFTIALNIHRHSISAGQSWNGTVDSTAIPLRVTEYVIARTKRDILSTFYTDPAGVGSGSITLGDLKLSGTALIKYLKDALDALDGKIVALEYKLRAGDSSAIPYTDHRHQSLPARSTSASPGETPGRDYSSLSINRSLTGTRTR
jgi:hypothetical protein